MTERNIGDLDEVLNNLGVFRSAPEDLLAICPSGFRRVPISQGNGYYLSLQGFGANQPAFAHTHPDSEEWVVVLAGSGQALFSEAPVALTPGVVVGRGARHPHGFLSEASLHMLSIQLPRPAEGATTWDQPGESTDPIECVAGSGTCRRCWRCGGHSRRMPGGPFTCENCGLEF